MVVIISCTRTTRNAKFLPHSTPPQTIFASIPAKHTCPATTESLNARTTPALAHPVLRRKVWDFPGHVDTTSAAVKPEVTYGSCGALVWVIDAQVESTQPWRGQTNPTLARCSKVWCGGEAGRGGAVWCGVVCVERSGLAWPGVVK